MDQRFEFVAEARKQEASISELCRLYGISRKAGYKWLRRYGEQGPTGLEERSRAPHSHPNAMAEAVQESLLEARLAHPTWGPRKVRAWLANREPETAWPAASTIGDLYRREGLSARRRRRRPAATPNQVLTEPTEPNAVWAIDFKGWFRTADGCRCDPFTMTDLYSRYLLRCQAVRKTDGRHVQGVMESAFREYGLPWVVRSDNGPPFGNPVALTRLSRFAVWLMKLGIEPQRIEPGKPYQNGKQERFHRTLEEDTASPPAASVRAQQERFYRFRYEYNYDRPHEALGQVPPATVYRASTRTLPARMPVVQYEAGIVVRKVSYPGFISWKGNNVYVSDALTGEPIGLSPVDGRYWSVLFGRFYIGVFDEADRWLGSIEEWEQRVARGTARER